MFTTPIALLIFNQPDATAQVFEVIRQIQPTQLFVIADGARPNRGNEAQKCADTRAILDRVDWDCEVLKNYADCHLGSKYRVATGLNWVFEEVAEAIILEADCLPDLSFFPFCQELLARYRSDTRIMSISGSTVRDGRQAPPYSYRFSHHCHRWGWATWQRAWQYFDVEMSQWNEIQQQNMLQDIFADAPTVKYWQRTLQAVQDGHLDTWNDQWNLASWLQSGLSINPTTSLVANVGFRADDTRRSDIESRWANLPVAAMPFPLQHPPFVVRDARGDHDSQKTAYEMGYFDRLQTKLKKALKRFQG